jgi:hypothetical protein
VVVELEPAAVVVELAAAEPGQAAEADLAGDQAAAGRAVAVPAEEVAQAPDQAVVAGLELVLVGLQGQALARVRQPRSALALAPHLARVRLVVPGWVPVRP